MIKMKNQNIKKDEKMINNRVSERVKEMNEKKRCEERVSSKVKHCNHKFKKIKEYMTKGCRHIEINAKECVVCGEVFISPFETERARKHLNPNIIIRIKDSFCNIFETTNTSIFKGRIL